MHGLRLIMKEDALPLREQPNFEALAEVARRGLLAVETWQRNRPHISLKTTIDVLLLGTVIEQNGDGLLEDSLVPVGWPLHLDEAVKQRCSAYDMKRDLLEFNYKAAQWSHRAVWNQWYMEPKRGHLGQLWVDQATDITKKVTNSTGVTLDDVRRAAAAAANKPTAQLPDSAFPRAGNLRDQAPPQTGSLAQRGTRKSAANRTSVRHYQWARPSGIAHGLSLLKQSTHRSRKARANTAERFFFLCCGRSGSKARS